MATQVQARDAMQFINEQNAATLERFIERLEFRAKDPTFAAYREAYLRVMELPRTAAVLDLGCGTGVVTRAIAARDGFAGTVTGVDQSPQFIAAAERLAADEGLGDRVELVVGDAHALDFPAASFDVAVAHTLVSHVRDPLTVLAEAARVIRPGGSVAVFDGDYASLTFGCDDPQLGQAMERAVQSMIMSSPRVMRELPRLLPKAGLRLVATQAHGMRRPDRAASCSTWPRPTGRWQPRRASCPRRTSMRGSPTSAGPPATARSSRPATTTPTWRAELLDGVRAQAEARDLTAARWR
jgi:ubiquinone/menaquinone biosynthesis C-methylase UbiE